MEEILSDMERPGAKRQASPKGSTSKKKKETELTDLSRRLERLGQLEKDNSALLKRNELKEQQPVYIKQGARSTNDLLTQMKELSGGGKFRIASMGPGQDSPLIR